MAEVVSKGHPVAKARSPRLIASARWGLTSLSGKPSNARDLCGAHPHRAAQPVPRR
jgi:hypothetical protein